MKKLCAKQNRRAKQWAKIENFANTSQCVRNLSEFGNAVAKLAMRNFAKLLKFYVRSEVRKCTVNVFSEFRNAN